MRLLFAALFALTIAAPAFAQQPTPATSPTTTPSSAAPTSTTPSAAAKTPAAPSPAQLAQRARMTSCNADAGTRNFKGKARSDFMSACLGGKATPQVMMSTCNAEATQEKMPAPDRKTYLASCLKKSGTT